MLPPVAPVAIISKLSVPDKAYILEVSSFIYCSKVNVVFFLYILKVPFVNAAAM